MLLTILHYISGPVIGAVIGAFTNFIAIKMLFRPLKAVKIGRFTLPFTPGVIPRHQAQLADALADTVVRNFFSNSDIEGIFMSEEMSRRFSEGILERLSALKLSELSDGLSEDTKQKIREAAYEKFHLMLQNSDLSGLVAGETEKIIRTKVRGGFVSSLLLNDEVTKRLSSYVGKEVEEYVLKNDLELLHPILVRQSGELKGKSLSELMTEAGMEKETALELIRKGYLSFMEQAKEEIAESFHIRQFIHDKIMELNPAEIEQIVNAAIKREMNYLVYLGGLLGFIIGIINIFI